uniref:WD_REPEATS_REGION domain-containing protein n=1 Tax=Angiostrongylus cantonensis TaxID=6313 RepID=A0A0K0DLD3_ANGCA
MVEAFRELREEIQCNCYGWSSASTSIAELCSHREILKPRGGSSMCLGIKTVVVNQFLPNCRRLVDKLKSKSFCCQFVKGGSELLVASQDGRIRFFQQCGPRDRYLLKNAIQRSPNTTVFSTMAVFSLRFSQKGHEILCGGSDRSLHIFDLESMARIVTINNAHGDDVNAVCYGDTDSHLLYSGGDDGLVKVYDRRALGEFDHQPVGVFAGHRDGITYIDARGDGRHLISNSKDQTIKLWDLRRFSSYRTVQKTLYCVRKQSWDYRWQPAPNTNYSSLKGDTSVVTFRGHSVLHTLVRAKFSPSRTGRRYIYTGCARGEVIIYDLLANSPSGTSTFDASLDPVICRLSGHMGVVRDVDWHPTSNEIVTSAQQFVCWSFYQLIVVSCNKEGDSWVPWGVVNMVGGAIVMNVWAL